jgi:hypothetical protein
VRYQRNTHYLYHIRDFEESSGPGFDGYVGITQNPRQREKQHFDALRSGSHRNEKLQAAYNAAPNRYRFWLLTSGPCEVIEARERLLVPRRNHKLNKQMGGGRSRGISQDEAVRRTGANSDSSGQNGYSAGNPAQRVMGNGDARGNAQDFSNVPEVESTSSRNDKTAGESSQRHERSKSSPPKRGKASATSVIALAGDITSGAAVIAVAAASGLGTAYAVNKHLLKDDDLLDRDTRDARRTGRIASYLGGTVGAGGTVTAVCLAGEVGLGAAGVTSGLTAVGTIFGGGAIAGAGVVLIVPGLAALTFAYAGYKVHALWRKRKLRN